MRTRAMTVGWGALLGLSCIIPDRDIGLAGEDNTGAVRILFRPPMLQEMEDFCNRDPRDDPDLTFCPAARPSRPPGLITAGPDQPFCICPSGADNRAIEGFSIFAEDPDDDLDGPRDTLYGALFLDPDPDSERPTEALAYRNYLEPCGPGYAVDSEVNDATPRTIPTEVRDQVFVWQFLLDDGSGRGTIDLCNDDNGKSLPPGLHNLQFIVTDRPFFRPTIEDFDGDEVFGPQQCGVPDLSVGATYAVAEWVFECRLAGQETDPQGQCDCATEGP